MLSERNSLALIDDADETFLTVNEDETKFDDDEGGDDIRSFIVSFVDISASVIKVSFKFIELALIRCSGGLRLCLPFLF